MVKFSVPFFPPSTNQAFFVKHGRMHLAKEGKKFKLAVTSYLAQNYRREILFFKKNMPYHFYLRLHMENLENKGWPDKCDTRYKIFDATNRVKLAEDACKEAFGIDDSQTIAFLTHKCEVAKGASPYLELFVWSLEEEPSPLDEYLRF